MKYVHKGNVCYSKEVGTAFKATFLGSSFENSLDSHPFLKLTPINLNAACTHNTINLCSIAGIRRCTKCRELKLFASDTAMVEREMQNHRF